MRLPVRATQDSLGRESEMRTVDITTVYRLVRGERFLRIKTTIDNVVEDHILRALFPTGVTTDVVHAETPFDVVERNIPLLDTHDWREPYKPVQPQQNFVDISDGNLGVAILNKGLPQYEAIDDPQRTIALTLLRAHRSWYSMRLAHFPDQTGNQLQGRHTFEYAVLCHNGDWETGQVQREAERFNVEPIVGAAGPGKGDLPTEFSFVEVEGEALVLNALKKGEWDDSLIIRLSNPSSSSVEGAVNFHTTIAKAETVNLMETKVLEQLKNKDGRISVSLGAKKILTVRIELAKRHFSRNLPELQKTDLG